MKVSIYRAIVTERIPSKYSWFTMATGERISLVDRMIIHTRDT